jgi:hypothetical protein
MEESTRNGQEHLQSQREPKKRRKDWKKMSIHVLAVIGALFLFIRLVYFDKWFEVQLEPYSGGATYVSHSWWGLREQRFPLRSIKTDYYGEWSELWCIKVSGKWIPLNLDPDPEDY